MNTDIDADHWQRLNALWDHSPAGVAAFDGAGRLATANPSFCKLLGYPLADLLGRLHAEFVHPQDALPVAGADGAASGEIRYLTRAGTAAWVDLSTSGVPGRDGQLPTTIAVAIDVSARKSTEERLGLAVEATETGLWTWDVASGVVTWSAECYAIHGMREGDFAGTHEAFFRLVHPEDAARVDATVRGAIEARRLYDCEFRILRPDGGVAWVANRGRARYDAAGHPVFVLGTITDISARKDAEQALQVALEASRTGTFRWDIRAGTLAWDGALHKLFGLPPGEEVKRLEDFIARVHPADRADVVALCERCREEGADFEMEFRLVRPDGSVRWLYDRGRTFTDSAGRAISMTGACVDVTERKQVRDALQQRERELRTIADNAPDIIARFDRSLRHLFVGAAIEKITGRPARDFIGRTNRELGMPAALCEQWDEAVQRVFAQGTPHAMHFSLERDGVVRRFASRLVPERDAAGTVVSVLGVTRDVTEAWEAQEALRRADRQKDDFLATLAHELRNPLAPIRTGLAVLQHRGGGNAEEKRVRDIMERQLTHLVRLVDELLDIARISQGKVVLRREVLPLQTILAHALDTCRPLVEAQGHVLEAEAAPADWLVLGDETRLAQVLGNLLNNAAKYTPRGGRISVRVREEGGELLVVVEDTGYGIPRDMLGRIFERFVQADQHLERSQGGLGIGLSVVRSLVEMHGGRVAADSAGPGAGSRFSVWLPRAEPQVLPIVARPSATAPDGPGRRVLVVDDNVDAAETLSLMIGMGGHTVRLAFNGPAGLAAAQEFDPDVVFLDIGMPGMSGYEVARALRALPGGARRQLVALTGWGADEDRARSIAAGFDVHLTKPVGLEQVEALLVQPAAVTGGAPPQAPAAGLERLSA